MQNGGHGPGADVRDFDAGGMGRLAVECVGPLESFRGSVDGHLKQVRRNCPGFFVRCFKQAGRAHADGLFCFVYILTNGATELLRVAREKSSDFN